MRKRFATLPPSYQRKELDKSFMLSVILSFRNEEEVIPELVKRLDQSITAAGIDYELLFINDDSNDGSLELLRAIAKENPRVKTINMARNFGGPVCMVAGLEYALGDAAVIMDADLQDPPELIGELLNKLVNEHCDLVYTVRTKRHGEKWLKMKVTELAYITIRTFSGIDLKVNAGIYKLVSRRMIDEFLKLKEHDPFMKGLLHWPGFKQGCVYYDREERFAGEPKFQIFGSLNPVRELIAGMTSFSSALLKLSLIAGIILSILSFLYLLVVIGMYINNTNLPGWTTIVGLILIFGSAHFTTIGIVGVYIGRIYEEVKGRPRYIVRDCIGIE